MTEAESVDAVGRLRLLFDAILERQQMLGTRPSMTKEGLTGVVSWRGLLPLKIILGDLLPQN